MSHLRISVVTATFNQASTIEETIVSVLGQNYPNLQYIIIDGGSTDGTIEIIKKYSDRISVFISEPDQGQYFAINKGVALADGEILCWLNGDDLYFPWTLRVVNDLFTKFAEIDWLGGLHAFAGSDGALVKMASHAVAYPAEWIRRGFYSERCLGFLQQESMFWRRSLWAKSGGLNTEYRLAADFALWVSFAEHTELVSLSIPLAQFRMLPGIQRSSRHRDRYNAEVAMAISMRNPKQSWFPRAMARLDRRLRALVRLFIWARARCVIYSTTSQEWLLVSAMLPASKHSLPVLVQEQYAAESRLRHAREP